MTEINSYNIIRSYYQNKKILLAGWDCENKQDSNASQAWYSNLKKIFGKVATFSPKKNYFIYGKEVMNRRFLELINKEKPDFIFFTLIYDEFDPKVFVEIKERFPELQMISFNSDDSWRFGDYYQYYSLFFDYILTPSHYTLSSYKKNGIKGVSVSYGVNLDYYRPLNLEKKYDVVFIGRPGKERVDYLKFLINEGIKVNIWGDGWGAYPEFKSFYHGILSSEDWLRVVNQSKINLNFSMGGDGKPQFKGRTMEVFACKSFCLVGYCKDYLNIFNNNEIVMFKDKKDLLKKINYYLIKDDKREKIANSAYKKIIKKYNLELELYELFNKIKNKEKQKFVFSLFKKVKYISISEFNDRENKLKNYDYVCFKIKSSTINPLKENLQVYSLENSEKDISCCDYYVNSPKLGNYLLFKSKQSFDRIGEKANCLVNPAQLMVKKKYFLRHLNLFKNLLEGKTEKVIKDNAVFVSIPLIEIKKIRILSIKKMEESFQMKFLDNLGSLYIQKKPILFYLINLIFETLKGKLFILIILKNTIMNRSKLDKLKDLLTG